MKCIKNRETNEIVRVTDQQVNQMVGSRWEFVPKSEWKTVSRNITEKQEEEIEKKEISVSKKLERRKKIGEKQRQLEHSDKILK